MSTDIEWKDDGFFIHIKARDMASGEFYWRRAELGDCKLVISSLRQEVATAHRDLEALFDMEAADCDAETLRGIFSDLRQEIETLREALKGLLPLLNNCGLDDDELQEKADHGDDLARQILRARSAIAAATRSET